MKFIDKKSSIFVFAITLVTAVVLRCFQWTIAIDTKTGFFIGNDVIITALTGVIILGALLISIAVLFGKSETKEGKVTAFCADRSQVVKRTSITFASVLTICGLFILWDLVIGFSQIAFAGILKIFLLALQVLSAVVLLIAAFLQYANKPYNALMGYGFLIPTMWIAFRAAQLFKNSTVIVNNSQDLLKLLYLLSAILFFVYTARFYAGLEKRFTRQTIVITGMLTAILSFTTVIPAYIFGDTAQFAYDKSFFEVDLLIGVLAIGMMLKFFSKDYGILTEEVEVIESEENIVEE